jgi:TPR repeat protein
MGIGCRRDPLEANVWYVRAADAGYENARQRLEVIRAAAAGGGGDIRGAPVPSLGGREGPAKMTKAPAKARDLAAKGEKEKEKDKEKGEKGEKEKKKFMGIF